MPRAKKELMIAEATQQLNVKELKKEINEYIDQEIKKGFISEIDKSNKRLIKEKNRKILTRDIIIVLLVAFSGYLLFILYDNNYFDKYLRKSSNSNITIETKEKKEEKNEPTLDELKEKYGYLLDNVYINQDSDYINEYYDGNLTDELKNYLSLNQVNFDRLTTEDDYNMLDNRVLEDSYKNIFNTSYSAKTFKYNGNSVRFISKLDSYITSSILNKNDNNIKREIINIEIKNDNVEITTIEGIVNDNKVINPVSKEEVGEGSNLLDYQDKLAKLTYTFNKDKKLINLNK